MCTLLFKYLRSEHIKQFMAGQIRIGTLFQFRDVEKHLPDIGDQNEGKIHRENTVSGIFNSQNDVNKVWGMSDFIKIEGADRHCQFNNCTFTKSESSENLFILCLSYRRNDAIWSKYNACIEIGNPHAFFYEISKELFFMAEFKGWGKVTYSLRNIHYTDNPKAHPALLKEPLFECQYEVRAIWLPKKRFSIQPIFIQCQEAIKYCRLIY